MLFGTSHFAWLFIFYESTTLFVKSVKIIFGITVLH